MEKQCLLPIFPNPASRSANSRTTSSVPVSLPDHDLDLLKSTYTTAAVIDALLIKAWAVVLRCYTGSDDLVLGYQTELPGRDERLESHIMAIRIGDEDRTSELRKKGYEGRRLGPVQMTTDTAVRVTRICVQDRSMLVI